MSWINLWFLWFVAINGYLCWAESLDGLNIQHNQISLSLPINKKVNLFCSEYEFVLTDIQFKIIDVGEEREERVRWIDFLSVSTFCPGIKYA